jgi:hypothetical protein
MCEFMLVVEIGTQFFVSNNVWLKHKLILASSFTVHRYTHTSMYTALFAHISLFSAILAGQLCDRSALALTPSTHCRGQVFSDAPHPWLDPSKVCSGC